MQISEKEYAVINEIIKNHQPSQRAIAKNSGISLGMVNVIIKRLVNTGYIKIKGLNKGKVEYLLTPKGFAEKAQKTYNFTIRTIESLKIIKQKIQNFILDAYNKGTKNFYIQGHGELADLVEIAIRDLKLADLYCHVLSDENTHGLTGILLYAEQKSNLVNINYYNGLQLIDIMQVLSQ